MGGDINEWMAIKKSFSRFIAAISNASIPISEPRVPAPMSERFLMIFIGSGMLLLVNVHIFSKQDR